MSLGDWAFASLVATAVLAILLSLGQRLGWSRMSFPLLLGTVFSPNRDRALLIGTGLHLVAGFLLGAVYAACFEWLGHSSWWVGAIGGAIHGALVVLVLLPVLPVVHPRMASENHGPEPTAALEPPGPFGCNYGYATPLFALVAHLAYGTLLGTLYQV